MTNTTPPEPVERFIEAVNRGDTEAFLNFFPADGAVNDWGRRFVGHDAIRTWSDKEFIGAKGTLTLQSFTVEDNEVSMAAGWVSNYYTGDSRFIFVLDGKHIKEMRITSA